MTAVQTKLTTSGNSAAIRLPKELLHISGLRGVVMLEVEHGRIIISQSKNPRQGWEAKIKSLASIPPEPSREFGDMKVADSDGLDDLRWDGPSFEEWQSSK